MFSVHVVQSRVGKVCKMPTQTKWKEWSTSVCLFFLKELPQNLIRIVLSRLHFTSLQMGATCLFHLIWPFFWHPLLIFRSTSCCSWTSSESWFRSSTPGWSSSITPLSTGREVCMSGTGWHAHCCVCHNMYNDLNAHCVTIKSVDCCHMEDEKSHTKREHLCFEWAA